MQQKAGEGAALFHRGGQKTAKIPRKFARRGELFRGGVRLNLRKVRKSINIHKILWMHENGQLFLHEWAKIYKNPFVTGFITVMLQKSQTR